jgi:NTP pyrophosphatase (non-canonical NTP hydrolase)
MNFDEYQKEALKTDQLPYGTTKDNEIAEKVVPLLGLAGEAGELLSEYKKFLRDGEGHQLFKERIDEELGDLLWYMSNVASKFGLRLEDVARNNLAKIHDRWGGRVCSIKNFDAGFPDGQCFPRQFEVALRQEVQNGQDKIQPYINGQKFGDGLTDNFPSDDGYRFHDVFHLAYVAILGWSPVIRALMRRKRRSVKKYDEIEDGGRAIVIDEAIVALAFDYARDHGGLAHTKSVDFDLLKTIKSMTSHLEVSERTTGDWEKAIVDGFAVWRDVVAHDGGRMAIDLDARQIKFLGA